MSLPEGFAIRLASTADLDTLVAHRRAMFFDMGYMDDGALDSMSARFRVWLWEHMDSGEYRAWLILGPDGSTITRSFLGIHEAILACVAPPGLKCF